MYVTISVVLTGISLPKTSMIAAQSPELDALNLLISYFLQQDNPNDDQSNFGCLPWNPGATSEIPRQGAMRMFSTMRLTITSARHHPQRISPEMDGYEQ